MWRRNSPDSAPWMMRWSYVELIVIVFEMPRSAMVRWSAAVKAVGNPRVPTPTITPWPGINRGTERSVPIVPGFVRVTVTPAKSSGLSRLLLAFRMRSS